MSTQEEDDVYLHKASAALISDLQSLLKIILWKPSGRIHRLVRQRDLDRAIGLIEPFQEEPQLLDPQLKNIVPPLVDAFLLQLRHDTTSPPARTCTVAFAICRILYTLCKVRGEKVIVGFFNHDPPNLGRILSAYEGISGSNGEEGTWHERYVLMLWLWHLMLVPFDLQTLSDDHAGPVTATDTSGNPFSLPAGLPTVAARLVPICMKAMSSATKERDAAAKLLVRLAIRDDMRVHNLLHATVSWVMQELRMESLDPSTLHQKLGLLSFVSSLTASASPEVLSPFLDQIFTTCQAILSGQLNASLASNAVARKSLIKISRNTVLLCLQSPTATESLDPSDVLSEVVDTLLTMVGDSDTPVRYTASKVLSAITLKLEPEMAAEVIDAILGSLREDLIIDGNGRQSTDAVNALRWHGLTLALAQLLYRRAPSTDQLPAMLDALVLSLEFSQRSAAGVAVGTNVRDAACFGIWALSRRYTTLELLAVDLHERQSLTAGSSKQFGTVPMWLATHILAVACLDPSGNIRRGASAALQELIGRNPDTVAHGISLVQIVDYQAVGLRRRAMVDVSIRAAVLDETYFKVLYDALQGERALFSVDELSRGFAAEAFGLLCRQRGVQFELASTRHLMAAYTRLGPSVAVQERHGLFLALADVFSELPHRIRSHADNGDMNTEQSGLLADVAAQLLEAESLLDLPEKDFTSPTRNPHLTAAAVCRLIAALTSTLLAVVRDQTFENLKLVQLAQRLFSFCLNRTEPEVLELIPQCATNLLKLSPEWQSSVEGWLLVTAVQAQWLTRNTAHIIALGAAFRFCQGRDTSVAGDIINNIALRCTSRVEVDGRVLAVGALGLAVGGIGQDMVDDASLSSLRIAANALHVAMCDYTINERGDVGSLVRLEALSALTRLSQAGWQWSTNDIFTTEVLADIARLSLEKLDKVRSTARSCVLQLGWNCQSTIQVSSYAWFRYWLDALGDPDKAHLRNAILEGYCSSAGAGAENIVRESRAALVAFLQDLPLSPQSGALFTLVDFANLLKSTLSANLNNERVLLPALETLAFVLDMQSLHGLVDSSFNWRGLLIVVQKSHYQSKSIPKILVALDVYRSLAEVPKIRADVTKKLRDTGRNPMVPIKRATEETMYMVQDEWHETLS